MPFTVTIELVVPDRVCPALAWAVRSPVPADQADVRAYLAAMAVHNLNTLVAGFERGDETMRKPATRKQD